MASHLLRHLIKVYPEYNPIGLKDITYIELLLAREAIAPLYEENHDRHIWYKRDISPTIKAKYFDNKVFSNILSGKIINPETEIYGDQGTISNRLKYLVLEFKS